MKKIFALALAALMLVSMFACTTPANTKVKVIDIPLSVEEYAFAVAKDDADLLASVNAYLTKIQEDGTFDAICDKYFGDGTPTLITSAAKDASKDQLVVATSTGFEPFEMVDENGKFSGIDLEIAAGLAEYLGKELVIEDMQFASVITSVQQGICDIGMAGLTVTPAREEMVTFSNTYYNASQVIIAMESDTTFDECETTEDVVAILNALTADTLIGCQTGTTGEIYIDGDLDLGDEGYGFAGLPATKKAYDYGALAVAAMKNGQIKYVILDNAPAKAIANKVNA